MSDLTELPVIMPVSTRAAMAGEGLSRRFPASSPRRSRRLRSAEPRAGGGEFAFLMEEIALGDEDEAAALLQLQQAPPRRRAGARSGASSSRGRHPAVRG